MNKSTSGSNDSPNTARRSFMWKVGAAVSAVLAATVPAVSMPKLNNGNDLKGEVERLARKIKSLEDENKIRELHRTFETGMDNGSYENLVNLFSQDGEVIFNGGVFKGKEAGIRRLFCNCFRAGMTGKRITHVPGFELIDESQQDMIEVSKDRMTAKARFSYSIQVGVPVISDSVLFKMARLQGGGVIKWCEGGIYKASYIKNIKNETWKIKKLEYNTLSKAYYKPGSPCANPIDTPAFSKVYPEDPAGPDRLFRPVRGLKKNLIWI